MDASHALSGPQFLHIALPVSIALVVLGWLSTSPRATLRPGDTLDTYEAAWLAGGDVRLAATAIALLVRRGGLVLQRIETRSGWRRRTTRRLAVGLQRPDDLHPVEIACLGGVRDGVLQFDRAEEALAPAAAQIRDRLRHAGLASDPGRIAPARAAIALLAILWLGVALERIGHAIVTLRPVGFLVLLTLVVGATLLGLVLRRRATWRGRKALGELRRSLAYRRTRRGKAGRFDRQLRETGVLPMVLALLGPAAVLARPGFNGLDDAIGPRGMRTAGGGDGSSGDGGGGSGCGGGGGCGGGCGG
jgi:uncharacterized protein (TIGR04222 family)